MVAAKSTSDAYATHPFPPNPNSQQSTISTVEREIREAGGDAKAIAVDTRDFQSVQRMVDESIKVGDLSLNVGAWADSSRNMDILMCSSTTLERSGGPQLKTPL